jgi:hypothetical protein
MFLNSKKILKIIIPIIILITIGYFVMIEISILKKPNKNYIHNKKKINKETIKKFQNLLEETLNFNKENSSSCSDTYKDYNYSELFVICAIHKYSLLQELKVAKKNKQKFIIQLLLCNSNRKQNINYMIYDIPNLIKYGNYRQSCFYLYIGNNTMNKKKEIINYFNKRKKKIIYLEFNKDVGYVESTSEDVMEKLSQLNFIEERGFLRDLNEIFILCDPLEELLENEEFQIFLDEYMDI